MPTKLLSLFSLLFFITLANGDAKNNTQKRNSYKKSRANVEKFYVKSNSDANLIKEKLLKKMDEAYKEFINKWRNCRKKHPVSVLMGRCQPLVQNYKNNVKLLKETSEYQEGINFLKDAAKYDMIKYGLIDILVDYQNEYNETRNENLQEIINSIKDGYVPNQEFFFLSQEDINEAAEKAQKILRRIVADIEGKY